MINSIMNSIELISIGMIIIVIFCMIGRVAELIHIQQMRDVLLAEEQNNSPHIESIEIKSKDLRVEAENIINLVDIYSRRMYHMQKEIDKIEQEIQDHKSCSIACSDEYIETLIVKSLKIDEEKYKMESKLIRLNNELERIALEERDRQLSQ